MTGDVRGVVRSWGDEGWGVLDSAETPGGCWCHFSAVRSGPGDPAPGDTVSFTFEVVAQGGFDFRAVEARVEARVDGAALREPHMHDVERDGPNAAYVSGLSIELD